VTCIDLREKLGHRYRISHDPAAKFEPDGMNDPHYYVLPCKFGEIYPRGADQLALHCMGSKIRIKIKRAFPDIQVVGWTDDDEAVFVFPLSRFPEIAKLVKPKRKSGPGRKRLSEIGSNTRFSTALKEVSGCQNRSS
jgi:hypothetical protein